MAYCLKCKQEWRQERLEAVRKEAKELATTTNETMAIEKYGPIYKIVKAADAKQPIEYISKHS